MGWFFALRGRHPRIVTEIEGQLAATYERFSIERTSGSKSASWQKGLTPLGKSDTPNTATRQQRGARNI
jgi:hypothetical protein